MLNEILVGRRVHSYKPGFKAGWCDLPRDYTSPALGVR
jgi:hypothetical protein